jgi:signal peptidase I
MENTIIPGDKILVNKLSFGPRLPASPFEIPWINVLFYFNDEARKRIDEKWWDYRRAKGLSDFEPGQVMVFNYPEDDHVAYIKRCIAGPGDTLLIDKTYVFLNGQKQEYPGSLKIRHRLYTHNWKSMQKLLDSMNIRHFKWNAAMADNEYGIMADSPAYEHIKNAPCTDSICRFFQDFNVKSLPFLQGDTINWSIDCLGPYILPKKGMQIELNYDNYIKYSKLIAECEEAIISLKNGQITIDGREQKHYRFKSDYYFMVGDNRHDSNDSRYRGPVPEQMIIGKATTILFSGTANGFNWNRVMKRL